MNLFGLVYLQDWIIVVCILTGFLYTYSKWSFGYLEKQGVPTETPIPIFGNVWRLLIQPMHLVDLVNCKKFGKVHGFYEGHVPTVVIADISQMKTILVKNFNHFSDRRKFTIGPRLAIMKQFLFSMTGEEWKIARSILNPVFSAPQINQINHLIDECAQQLSAILQNELKNSGLSKDVNINLALTSYITSIIASCAFGPQVDCTNQQELFCQHASKLSNQNVSLKLIFNALAPKWLSFDVDIFPPNSISYFHQLAELAIQQRITTNSERKDLLQMLINAKIDTITADKLHSSEDHFNLDSHLTHTTSVNYCNCQKVLTHESIAAESIFVLLAGMNTVTTAMSFALYLLALNPECQDKLQAEIDAQDNINSDNISNLEYLNMVISEVLRLHPPITRLERSCTNDCTLGDIKIKRGMIVAIPIYAIHRDKHYYSNPETFNPERFSSENKSSIKLYSYMPFGAGPRNCIGVQFALTQMKLGLVYILKDFKVSKCDKTQIPVPTRVVYGTQIPINGITLKLSKRL